MTYFDDMEGAALKRAFEDQVREWPGVTGTTMFGCPSYRVDDELFAVLLTDAVVLTSLPSARFDAIDDAFETGPFQAGDRTVPSWLQVTIDDPTTIDTLLPAVRASYETARAGSTANQDE